MTDGTEMAEAGGIDDRIGRSKRRLWVLFGGHRRSAMGRDMVEEIVVFEGGTRSFGWRSNVPKTCLIAPSKSVDHEIDS